MLIIVAPDITVLEKANLTKSAEHSHSPENNQQADHMNQHLRYLREEPKALNSPIPWNFKEYQYHTVKVLFLGAYKLEVDSVLLSKNLLGGN